MHSVNSVDLPLILHKTRKQKFLYLYFFDNFYIINCFSIRALGNSLTRCVSKTGRLNVQLQHAPHQKLFLYSKDLANTLVSIRWRWVTILVILVNGLFYVLFGGLWMLDAYLSGDFDTRKRENFCIENANSFGDYLLLSIETLTTTGYGYFSPSENCTFAWLTLVLSMIIIILLDGAFISMVYLKICKPEKRDGLQIQPPFQQESCGKKIYLIESFFLGLQYLTLTFFPMVFCFNASLASLCLVCFSPRFLSC